MNNYTTILRKRLFINIQGEQPKRIEVELNQVAKSTNDEGDEVTELTVAPLKRQMSYAEEIWTMTELEFKEELAKAWAKGAASGPRDTNPYQGQHL